MISDMLYQIYIDHPPNSKKWTARLSLIKDPSRELGSSQVFPTIKAARVAIDQCYPEVQWVNARKAYLKSVEI
jgi:hypothetical protein